MHDRSHKPKRPRDLNQLAKSIVDRATGQMPYHPASNGIKNQAAVELGRLDGLKGGKAHAAKLSPDERSVIAKKAAQKRWAKP